MNAVISVIGRDTVGILAKVADICSKKQANIIDVTQSVINNYFAMFMFVDITNLNTEFTSFVDELSKMGKDNSLEIHVMHEDIFNSMHKI